MDNNERSESPIDLSDNSVRIAILSASYKLCLLLEPHLIMALIDLLAARTRVGSRPSALAQFLGSGQFSFADDDEEEDADGDTSMANAASMRRAGRGRRVFDDIDDE